VIGFSGRLKRRGPADSAYGRKRNVHRLDGGRIAAAGAGAVSRDGDGSAFLPADIATSATQTAGDSTRSCGGPQVPTFVQRPGTPTPTHCTTSLQPHYSTFRHVARCGCAWCRCRVPGLNWTNVGTCWPPCCHTI